jgi:hypothetical protein
VSGPKETAYDEQIAPLMRTIIAVCKVHNINMAATFALDHRGEESESEEGVDEPLYCTTVISVDESDAKGYRRVLDCRRVMHPPEPRLFAFTITNASPHHSPVTEPEMATGVDVGGEGGA